MNDSTQNNQSKPVGAQQCIQRALSEVFAEARARNPAYSLRAFSKKLKISPAALSEILNGKRDISIKLAVKLLKNLGADPQITSEVLSAFTSKSPKALAKLSKLNKTREFTILSADQFKIVAEWYHFAILSLFETNSCPQSPAEIAKRLGVRKTEIVGALDRLVRTGMLIQATNGTYQLTGAQFHTTDEISSSAIKASHARSFQLAQNTLEAGQMDRSDFTSLTMAINPAKLAKAKKIIREFRIHLARELEVDPKQEVYMLCVQLFPLSNAPTRDQGSEGENTRGKFKIKKTARRPT